MSLTLGQGCTPCGTRVNPRATDVYGQSMAYYMHAGHWKPTGLFKAIKYDLYNVNRPQRLARHRELRRIEATLQEFKGATPRAEDSEASLLWSHAKCGLHHNQKNGFRRNSSGLHGRFFKVLSLTATSVFFVVFGYAHIPFALEFRAFE
jgi:hypothetical protein